MISPTPTYSPTPAVLTHIGGEIFNRHDIKVAECIYRLLCLAALCKIEPHTTEAYSKDVSIQAPRSTTQDCSCYTTSLPHLRGCELVKDIESNQASKNASSSSLTPLPPMAPLDTFPPLHASHAARTLAASPSAQSWKIEGHQKQTNTHTRISKHTHSYQKH